MITIGVFLLGFALGIPTLASAYRVRDLWWVSANRAGLVLGPLLWLGAHLAMTMVVAPSYARSYVLGLLAFLLIHVAVYYAIRRWTRYVFRLNDRSGDVT